MMGEAAPAAPDNAPGGEQGGDYAGSEGAEESSLFLTADMLPPGMKVNAGDILEFKVVNPSDQDGHIEVVYNHGEGAGKEGQEGSESWENELRHEMSAQTPEGGQTGETMEEA